MIWMTESMRCQEALQFLQRGDAQSALGILRGPLEYPAVPAHRAFKELMEVLAGVYTKLRDPELAGAIQAAGRREYDAQALCEAATMLQEAGEHGLAAGFLARAQRMLPDDPSIVCALSISLEAKMMNAEAVDHLKASGLADTEPACRSRLAFNTLMSGDFGTAAVLVASLRESSCLEVRSQAAELGDILARLSALPPTEGVTDDALARWHFALSGAVLLHVAAEGFHGTGMKGRYALLFDEPRLIKLGILRAALVAREAGLPLQRIYALPDRDSRILGEAMGRVLNVPVFPWEGQAAPEPGVLVAYDLARLDKGLVDGLRHHLREVWLFVHGTCWTEPPPFAPDVTTLLHQRLVAPWDVHAEVYDAAQHDSRVLTDAEIPWAEVVAEIVDADPSTVDTTYLSDAQLQAMMQGLRSLPQTAGAGMFRTEGLRLPERLGSPVRSSRFRVGARFNDHG